MNAATKVIRQADVFLGQQSIAHAIVSRAPLIVVLLCTLLSAIAVVYVTNENRLASATIQAMQRDIEMGQIEHNNLLIEKASLVSSQRVKAYAMTTLHMRIPNHAHVVA